MRNPTLVEYPDLFLIPAWRTAQNFRRYIGYAKYIYFLRNLS